jgi:hypothetical protein
MTEYHPGDRVLIRKYGADYFGKVTAVGRTTVTVTFETKAGARKTVKVPGHRVGLDLKPYGRNW